MKAHPSKFFSLSGVPSFFAEKQQNTKAIKNHVAKKLEKIVSIGAEP